MAEYEATFNARDLDAARDLIAEVAVYLFSNETAHLSREAILSAISYNFTAIEDEIFQLKNLTWWVRTKSIAACIYDFTWSGQINGQSASGSGRGTPILKMFQWELADRKRAPQQG